MSPVVSVPSPVLPTICRFAPGSDTGPWLCHCARVTEAVVIDAVGSGLAETVAEVTALTEAGSGCRACHCRIQRVLAGLPAVCGGRFDLCHSCGCANAVCRCSAC